MNHSKRDIERKVENLGRGKGDGGTPLIFTITTVGDGTATEQPETPHPEFTVKPWPERRPNVVEIATPNVIPEPWCDEPTLFITTCENGDRYLPEPETDDNRTVPACRLWEALDEADLRRDVEIRQENGDPIPPFLEHYTE